LFSILGGRIRGAKVLDLYAGTGALGLEALSRGADRAVFVDSCDIAIELVKKNVELCGFSVRSAIIRRDLTKDLSFLQGVAPAGGFDLIFLDPPYRQALVAHFLSGIAELRVLAQDGLFVAEEGAEVGLAEVYPGLILADHRRYGDTGIWFYQYNQEDGG
jgi:16S rRNA (guanine966-N2)-methyltransferase